MKMNKELICSTCGSNDMQMVNNNYCVCRHCGTKMLLDNKPTNITNNEINLIVKGFDRSASFYEVEPVRSPDEFLRMALINLATENYTPGEAFDSDFSSVEIVYRKYAKVDVDLDISYTVSIGYNRDETYKEQEQVYNNAKGKYEYKTIQKTRKVTDWKPFNSSKDFSYTEGICLDHYDYDMDEEIQKLELAFPRWVAAQTKKRYNGENDMPSPQMPSQKQIDDIVGSCINNAVDKCKNSLPGDSYKDFSYSTRSSKDIKAYVVPQYKLDYRLGNGNYTIRALAGSEKMLVGTYPNASNVVSSQATKKNFPLFISTFIALPISILTSMIFFFISLSGVTHSIKIWGLVLCLGFCIPSIILGLCLQKKREKIINDTLMLYRKQKIDGLKNLLKKLNFDELSYEEIRKIENGEERH